MKFGIDRCVRQFSALKLGCFSLLDIIKERNSMSGGGRSFGGKSEKSTPGEAPEDGDFLY
ncbi:MAG: hypothetical protein ACKOKC_02030 [Chthoniobacterales bacterium]